MQRLPLARLARTDEAEAGKALQQKRLGYIMKERIISRVAAMFAKHGVKTVRMDDVAEELGVSKRTLYELFGDKETLVRECMIYKYTRGGETISAMIANAGNVMEEIFILMQYMRETCDEAHVRLTEEIRKYYPAVAEELARIADKNLWTGMRSMITRGMEQGVLRPGTSTDMLVAVFSYLFDRNFIEMLGFKYNISRMEAFEFLSVMFMRGAATPEGAEIIDRLESEKFRPDGDAGRK